MKILKITIVALFIMFCVWVLASFAEITAKNLHEKPIYSKANFFSVTIKKGVSDDA